MSDMTTITPEERARLRSVLSEHGNHQVEDRIILRLLNALEQAEARVKSRNNHIHRLLGEALESERNLDGMKSRLQETEARAEKAENELAGADAEISELRDELEDSRGTEKDAPNILCAIARLVGVYEHCQELGDDMGTMSLDAVQDLLAEKQKAEAENTRLTKMVDWLAGRCAEHCCDRWGCDCTCRVNGCAHENGMCSKPEPKDWAEAARRAVAAGEGTCQK